MAYTQFPRRRWVTNLILIGRHRSMLAASRKRVGVTAASLCVSLKYSQASANRLRPAHFATGVVAVRTTLRLDKFPRRNRRSGLSMVQVRQFLAARPAKLRGGGHGRADRVLREYHLAATRPSPCRLRARRQSTFWPWCGTGCPRIIQDLIVNTMYYALLKSLILRPRACSHSEPREQSGTVWDPSQNRVQPESSSASLSSSCP